MGIENKATVIPCNKMCTERTPTCHGECIRYKDWVEARKKLREIQISKEEYEKYIKQKRSVIDFKRYAIRRAYVELSFK